MLLPVVVVVVVWPLLSVTEKVPEVSLPESLSVVVEVSVTVCVYAPDWELPVVCVVATSVTISVNVVSPVFVLVSVAVLVLDEVAGHRRGSAAPKRTAVRLVAMLADPKKMTKTKRTMKSLAPSLPIFANCSNSNNLSWSCRH